MKSYLLQRLRSRRFQGAWERLHNLSLIGMNYWSSDLHATGEKDVIAHLVRRLSGIERPVIFDVGANVGEFSQLCLAQFGERCVLHAFEPSRHTFELLGANLGSTAAGSVHLHNLGFSNEEKEETLYSSEPGSTIASVHRLEQPIRPFREEFSERIRLSTIDRFCADTGIDRIDFLKLDIEGHELQALQGAERMLGEGRVRFLQFEFGENNRDSRTYLADFHRLLGERWTMYRIVPGGLAKWSYRGGRSEIFATMNYLAERLD